MKFDVVRFGCAVSAFWGIAVLFLGIANMLFPGYGAQLLKGIASIYPGYHYGEWGFWGVLVATAYAVVDGWIAGIIFAWLYNVFTRKKRE